MGIHVALLRGINVGGKNKLPMKELTAILEGAGASEVRTYIQSGNVIFRGPAAAGGISDLVQREISRRFGYRIPVVLRTGGEMKKLIQRNPFVETGVDPKVLHVSFLESRPSAGAIKKLDPDRSPPDTFVVSGREIFLCCPNGVARSKLTNQYFDSRLETVSTARNWKTVLKLVELATGR